jgi:hypothetical protein
MTMLCINIMRVLYFKFCLTTTWILCSIFKNHVPHSHFLLTNISYSQTRTFANSSFFLCFLSFSPICKKFKCSLKICLCFYCFCNCVSRWFPTTIEDVMEFSNIIHFSEPMKRWNILKRIRKFYPILNFEYLESHKQMIQTKIFKFSNKNIGITLSNVIAKKNSITGHVYKQCEISFKILFLLFTRHPQ